MQIATEPAALLLTRRDQSFPGTLNLSGQADSVSGGANLPGQVFQEPAVGAREGVAGGAGRERELSHRLCLVDEWQVEEVRARSAICGGNAQRLALAQRDGDVWQLQRLGDGLDDRRQHRFRRQRCLQPSAEAGDDSVGIVTIPVDEAVDEPLHPVA